jgi:hypothetical protein
MRAARPDINTSMSWSPVNGRVSALASSGRSATALAVSELADSPAEPSWLARAGASDAPCARAEPLSWAAALAFDALPAAELPEPEAR